MEGDVWNTCNINFQTYFNPLPPHGGRRTNDGRSRSDKRFQSTPSAWRETFAVPMMSAFSLDFNPLPPHGGRQKSGAPLDQLIIFQSTPSAWRETFDFCQKQSVNIISIHSLRMEGDGRGIEFDVIQCISIHSLRMEGDLGHAAVGGDHVHISIHSLRMEGDRHMRSSAF